MEWLLPIVTLGAKFLGGMFGTNQAQNTTAAVTSNEALNNKIELQNQSTQNQVTSQTAKQQSTQNTAQTSESQTNQTGQTAGTQTTVGGQTATESGLQVSDVSRLDSDTLGRLTSSVKSLLDNTNKNAAAGDVIRNQITGTSNFDADAYVKSVMDAAGTTVNDEIQTGSNRISAETGDGANSAAVLLKQKLQNQGRSNLAGIRGEATAQAEALKQQGQQSKTTQLASIANTNSQDLNGILQAMLGANEKQTTQNKSLSSGQTQQQTADQSITNQQTGTTGKTNTNTTGVTTTSTLGATTAQEGLKSEQVTNQSTSTQQNSSGTTNQQSSDWSSFFDTLSGAFSADFTKTPS